MTSIGRLIFTNIAFLSLNLNTGPFAFLFAHSDFNVLIFTVLASATPKLNTVNFGLVVSSFFGFVSNLNPVPGVSVVAAVLLPPKANTDLDDCYWLSSSDLCLSIGW